MSTVNPEEYSVIMPFLLSTDMDKSLAFYEESFGFSRENVNVQNGAVVHAELKYQGRIVALIAPEGAHGEAMKTPRSFGHDPSLSLFLYVADVDEVYKNALKAILMRPKDGFNGMG